MCIIALVATCFWTTNAAAQEEPVLRLQVLDFRSIEGDDDFSRGISMAIRMGLMGREGWSVNERSVLLTQMTLAHGCDDESNTPSAECYAQIADTFGDVDAILTGVVQRSAMEGDEFEYLVYAEVYDVRTGRIAGAAHTSIPRQAPNAEIVNRVQHLIAELASELVAGVAEIVPPPPPRTAPARDPLPQILGWSLLGGGAVSFALMGVSWGRVNDLQGDSGYHAFRLRVPSTIDNICREAAEGRSWRVIEISDEEAREDMRRAQNVCSEASTWETMQFVFMGAGIALAGVGASLLVLDAMQETPSVSFRSSFGPEHAYLEVFGSF